MLKNIILNKSDMQYPHYDTSVHADIDFRKTEAIVNDTSPVNYEYIAKLVVYCKFYTTNNDAHLEFKLEEASKQLAHELYKDVISKIREAISTTNNPETIKILLNLISEMTSY